MFSGIVEGQGSIREFKKLDHSAKIKVERPSHFDDLKRGDSIACNGVCLTLENPGHLEVMEFTLGHETLQILGESLAQWQEYPLHLERSLRYGDRIHGHLVTGHVEALGKILESHPLGPSWILRISLPTNLKSLVWKKGSITVDGVSLTINELGEDFLSVCLIPETLERTHLGKLPPGAWVNLEADYFAHALAKRIHHGNE